MFAEIEGDMGDEYTTTINVTQISQSEAGYTPTRPETGDDRRCATCVHWLSEGACNLIANEPQAIVSEGVCRHWQDDEDEDDDMEESDAPTAAAEMTETTMRETVREIGAVSTFRGTAPVVPNAPEVDIAGLTAGDDSPVFVTLKIAEVGRVSKNGILYDEALVKSIVEQVNRKRPGGIFGHIKPEERDTAFPLPDGIWIGAILDGKTAWGKAYIRRKEAAEYVRQLKAVSGELGTSIWGDAVHVPVPSSDGTRGVKRLEAFELNQLDFAPPERASLRIQGNVPVVTTEMESRKGEGDMNRDELKAALKDAALPDIMEMLGEDVLRKVADEYMKKTGKRAVAAEMVSEMEAAEAQVTEMAAQTARLEREVSELRTRVSEYEAQEFNSGLTALVNSAIDWRVQPEHEAAVAALKSQLRREVTAELAGKHDLRLAEAKMTAIMESNDFRPIVESVMAAVTGGPAKVGGQGKPNNEELLAALQAQARRF